MHIKLLIMVNLGEGAFSAFNLEVCLNFPNMCMNYFMYSFLGSIGIMQVVSSWTVFLPSI